MNKDTASTVAGAAWGWALLQTVKWELVPFGESVKIVIALLIILGGCLLYYRESHNKTN